MSEQNTTVEERKKMKRRPREDVKENKYKTNIKTEKKNTEINAKKDKKRKGKKSNIK